MHLRSQHIRLHIHFNKSQVGSTLALWCSIITLGNYLCYIDYDIYNVRVGSSHWNILSSQEFRCYPGRMCVISVGTVCKGPWRNPVISLKGVTPLRATMHRGRCIVSDASKSDRTNTCERRWIEAFTRSALLSDFPLFSRIYRQLLRFCYMYCNTGNCNLWRFWQISSRYPLNVAILKRRLRY